MTAVALVSLIFVAAGCDDYVQITRDRDVHIPRNATWAWRPVVEEPAVARNNRGPNNPTGDNRPVISRDEPARNQPVRRGPDPNDEIVRGRVRTAIEQTLASKGFKQVSDPGAADFLVDYKYAANRHDATVPVAYGTPYPGLVCGPFRCWDSWGYGPAFVGYENIRFREGMIVFDLIQTRDRHQVYRAIGQKPVRRDAFSLTQDEINDLTHHLLKDLKTGKK
ncbi:MAG TPA: DUF4136 domain-containing protein [Candidatus Acidoferrum sp.]